MAAVTGLEGRRLSPWLAKILTEKSPKHALAALTDEPETTEAFETGKAIDALVFPDAEGIRPERAARAAVMRANAKPGEHAVARAVRAEMGERLTDGARQVKLEWEADGGVLCKAYADLIWQNEVLDLKTAADLSDDGITRSIERYGYDMQLAAEVEAVTALGMIAKPLAALYFAEKSRPYDVRRVVLDAGLLGAGMARWRKACKIWKDCLASGNWPGRGEMTARRSPWRARKEATSWADDFQDVK
jgi:hypothetical protein